MTKKKPEGQAHILERLKPLDHRIERLEVIFQKFLEDMEGIFAMLREFVAAVRETLENLENLVLLGMTVEEPNAHVETRLELVDIKLESVDARFAAGEAKAAELKSFTSEGFGILFDKIAQLEQVLTENHELQAELAPQKAPIAHDETEPWG